MLTGIYGGIVGVSVDACKLTSHLYSVFLEKCLFPYLNDNVSDFLKAEILGRRLGCML